MSIYKKLAEIQKKVKGLGVDKQATGYKYVTGAKVLEFIKPLMIEHGLLLKQEVLSIDNSRQDYQVSLLKNDSTGQWSGKPKSEILTKVMMKFTWIDVDTGEKDENMFGANGQNDWEKGLGSALTYAERYFLLKYFHIATDEDDVDNPDRKEVEKQKKGSTADRTKEPQKEDDNFTSFWNSLKEERRVAIGEKYPNKFGKPQTNPKYFSRDQKEEILKMKFDDVDNTDRKEVEDNQQQPKQKKEFNKEACITKIKELANTRENGFDIIGGLLNGFSKNKLADCTQQELKHIYVALTPKKE